MNYHINTGLIIEQFRANDGCPLCNIQRIVQENICKELLADGCMDDAVRTEVNAKGFCEKHFDMLFSMPSKLSLALQLITRTKSVLKGYNKPVTFTAAKKLSAYVVKTKQTCIVCDYTEREMVKYYKAIPALYDNENEFKTLFSSGDKICENHFARLLNYSNKAGKSKKIFLSALYNGMLSALEHDVDLLNAFATRHDYRNIGKPLGEAENAFQNIRCDLYGKK